MVIWPLGMSSWRSICGQRHIVYKNSSDMLQLIRAEPRVAACFCTYSLLYVAIYVPCFVASPRVVVDVVTRQHYVCTKPWDGRSSVD